MKIAIIGSRNLHIGNIERYLPSDCSEIVSGGAKGIDACAEQYAREHHIPFTLFFPDYNRYGRAAPIVRNKQIVEYADEVIAFWDGRSKGTLSVIQYCKKTNTPCVIIAMNCE